MSVSGKGCKCDATAVRAWFEAGVKQIWCDGVNKALEQ
jgi:hypothetical protein